MDIQQLHTCARSEPCSPMIGARSTEEMRADLELVNLGKDNKENWGEGESSPLFKRPSSLCVKTPVSQLYKVLTMMTIRKIMENLTGEDPNGCVHFHPSLQRGQGQGFG